MNFLEKLDYLMEKHNTNKNKLAIACDVSPQTITNWYKRGYDGIALSTIKKISAYFNITIAYWADDDMIEPIYITDNTPMQSAEARKLPNDEEHLLDGYRKLNTTGQKKALEYIEDLADNSKYKKTSTNERVELSEELA